MKMPVRVEPGRCPVICKVKSTRMTDDGGTTTLSALSGAIEPIKRPRWGGVATAPDGGGRRSADLWAKEREVGINIIGTKGELDRGNCRVEVEKRSGDPT